MPGLADDAALTEALFEDQVRAAQQPDMETGYTRTAKEIAKLLKVPEMRVWKCKAFYDTIAFRDHSRKGRKR